MYFEYVCFIVISFGSNSDCYKYRNIFITTAVFHLHAPVKTPALIFFTLPHRNSCFLYCWQHNPAFCSDRLSFVFRV